MTNEENPSVHASAVRVGTRAILIRGPSGSGKSHLAFDLIVAGRVGQIPGTVLVGDDRVYLARKDDDIVVRPVPDLAGLIEVRGLGLRRCDFVNEAIVGMIVDLAAADAERLPPLSALRTVIQGIEIPRIPVGSSYPALPLVVASLLTTAGFDLNSAVGALSIHGGPSTFA